MAETKETQKSNTQKSSNTPKTKIVLSKAKVNWDKIDSKLKEEAKYNQIKRVMRLEKRNIVRRYKELGASMDSIAKLLQEAYKDSFVERPVINPKTGKTVVKKPTITGRHIRTVLVEQGVLKRRKRK